MISLFVQEQKRYTQLELSRLFRSTEAETIVIIRKLKEYGVLKAVRATDMQRAMSDLLDEDIEVAEVESGETDYYYVFTFVGIISIAGRVLKCYPKYIHLCDQPVNELRQIIKVLERYNSKEQIIRMYNDSAEEKSFNLLAVLLYLLNDYYENGSYSSTQEIVESNGSGEILWDKTINETFTLISNNRPYYPDLQTRKRITDDFDYFKRLHECVLSLASKELRASDLLTLFDIMPVELSDEELSDFGERDYILYRIERELNVQFNTRKQLVLKTLYSFVSHEGGLYDIDAFSMFGTNSFNLVWERVCAEVMDNQLQTPIGVLRLPLPLHPDYHSFRDKPLIDLIEKPIWIGDSYKHIAADTLIPDLVSLVGNHDDVKFCIFDAKYYTPQLQAGKPLRAQPGIDSITKQYLYQLAFQSFVQKNGISRVVNCFLMPTEYDHVIDKGVVSLPMLDSLGLEKIQVRFLPAVTMYNYYLAGRKYNIEALSL